MASSMQKHDHENPMEATANEEARSGEIREVRITSGITPEDVEALLEMAAASGLFSPDLMMSAEDMAWDSAYGDGDEDHAFLKASISGADGTRLAGFICYGPVPHWNGNHELYGIAVDPQFQRLGIGSALISEMIRRVGVEGGKRIFLETGDSRQFENARLFYEANGFVMEHRFCKQFIPTDGDVVYRFDLDGDTAGEQYQ